MAHFSDKCILKKKVEEERAKKIICEQCTTDRSSTYILRISNYCAADTIVTVFTVSPFFDCELCSRSY